MPRFVTNLSATTRTPIIKPTESWVLDPTRRPTLVLTTYHPKYGSSQRLIVEADLVSSPAG